MGAPVISYHVEHGHHPRVTLFDHGYVPIRPLAATMHDDEIMFTCDIYDPALRLRAMDIAVEVRGAGAPGHRTRRQVPHRRGGSQPLGHHGEPLRVGFAGHLRQVLEGLVAHGALPGVGAEVSRPDR